MDNLELRNEIEMRMNPNDFSVSSSDLIDIMNMFDVDEQKIVDIYSEIFEEKKAELKETTEEVIDQFRAKGHYYPSYKEFKALFDTYEDGRIVNDNILRDMYKQTITDKNQLSLFEIVKDELKKVMNESGEYFNSESDEDFDTAASKIMKNWGGEIKKSRSAKLNPEDMFDMIDAGAAARADIEGEFGEDEFMPMTDDEYKNIMKGIYEDVDDKGLFQVEDSEGNIIKKHALVAPVEGVDKKGRVMGFGDDGQGRMQLIVTWEWPTDMKFTNPEEMGEERVYPESIVLAASKNIKENDSTEVENNKLRGVKVTYADGTVIPTSMAAHLTDDEIHNYFKPGKIFNIGSVEDNMQAVDKIEIIREDIVDDELPGSDHPDGYSFDRTSLYKWFQDALWQLRFYDEAVSAKIMEKAFNRDYDYKLKMSEMKNEDMNEEINEETSEIDERGTGDGDGLEMKELEEMRGLGSGVKNSGDRNVKLRDDHHHAPLTNLDESVDGNIKKLFEGTVTKKKLVEFINEQAKEVASKLKK